MKYSEFKLKKQEIDDINNNIYKLENDKRIKENDKDLYIKTQYTLATVTLISSALTLVSVFGVEYNLMGIDAITLLKIYCSINILPIVGGIFNQFNISKVDKDLNKLNIKLNENNELLLTKTNALNELKNKTNEKENICTNVKHRNTDYSDSLTEEKINSKIRTRKR